MVESEYINAIIKYMGTVQDIEIPLPEGANPYGVAINPTGTFAYVANYNNGNVGIVSVIDTATNTVAATMPIGNGPIGVAINPAGTKAYVTNTVDSTVSAIDTTTLNPLDTYTILVGNGPIGVAINPAGTKAYVTNYDDGTVLVIDLVCPSAPKHIRDTVTLKATPRGGTYPYRVEFRKNVVPIDSSRLEGLSNPIIDTPEDIDITRVYALDAADIRAASTGSIDFSVHIEDSCPTGHQTCTAICT